MYYSWETQLKIYFGKSGYNCVSLVSGRMTTLTNLNLSWCNQWLLINTHTYKLHTHTYIELPGILLE